MAAFGSLIGQQVDRYEIEAQLGQGGFGVVYLARHTVLGTKVALKVLWPDHADDPRNIERFLREARAAASVGSEHIARLLDAGISGEHVFLAMEVLRGHDLDEELETRGPLPVDTAVHIAMDVLEALARAHEVRIIHRDLKPANVFLAETPDGVVVKLLDFGISKVAGQKSLTATGAIVGTPQYMAPEQIDSLSLDARADLYAVGILLYQMLTNTVPFPGSGYEVLVERMRGRTPTPLGQVKPDVPGPVVAVVDRALSVSRETRWRSADEMRHALGRALAGEYPDLSEVTLEDQPAESLLPKTRGPVAGAQEPVARTELLPSERPPPPAAPVRTELLPSERPPAPAPYAAPVSSSAGPSRGLRTERLPSEPASAAPVVSQPVPASLPPPSAASWVASGRTAPPRPIVSSDTARAVGWIAIAGLAVVVALGLGVLGVLLHRLATREPRAPAHTEAPAAPGVTPPGENPSPAPVSPGAVNPGAVNPGAANPGAVNPGAVNPGAVNPGAVNPGAADQTAGEPTPVAPIPSAVDPSAPDAAGVRYRVASHVGFGSRRAMNEVYERARMDVARCGGPAPVHVAVQLIATVGGQITIAQPSQTHRSDDLGVASCVAGAIADNGPAAFRGTQSAVIELEVDVPAR